MGYSGIQIDHPLRAYPLQRSVSSPAASQSWPLVQRLVAAIALIALTPIIGIMFLAVKLSSPGAFLFSQERKGFNGKKFRIRKVRTMRNGSEKSTRLGVVRSDPRVTTVGRFLRAVKLDELPQLWNVMIGDMLIVGPRPIPLALGEELSAKIPGFQQRYQVHPGLTSIGQVCVKDNALGDALVEDWRLRFEGELHYLRNRSVPYDLLVIGLTCLYVLKSLLPNRKSVSAKTIKTRSDMNLTRILGISIANLNYDRTVERIIEWGRLRENRYIGVCNVHSVTSSLWTPKLRQALLKSDLNTPDGVPLVWMQKLMGHANASRVYGPTLMLRTLTRLNEEKMSIAFYGGHPDRLKQLETFVSKNYPDVKIVESISPPFGIPSDAQRIEYENRLIKAKPHVIWVGIGCPKQEIWMQENSRRIPGVMVGVGAAFDFHIGAVRQAPRRIQRLGLEWAFRLYCEPRRLLKRYLSTNPVFILCSAVQIAMRFCANRQYIGRLDYANADSYKKPTSDHGYAD